MQLSADPHPQQDGSETTDQLIDAVSVLERGLAILDSLGMDASAGHVSYGLEMVRERLHSLQNGGSSPS